MFGSARITEPELSSRRSERASFDRALVDAVRPLRLLAAVTPANLTEERARLLGDIERGHPSLPRYIYAPVERTELRRRLEALSARVADVMPAEVAGVYRARIEELDLEARIAEASGSARLGELSRQRFEERDPRVRSAASRCAREWLALLPEETRNEARVVSDSGDPDSLLSSLRRAVGKERIPFTVEVSEALSSRAATGERTIWVAKGRELTLTETRRTVVHEVFGHALPRVRAAQNSAIFAIGTARGTDEQEGFALLAEERAGFFDDARRRELGARHEAVERMTGGQDFVEVVRALVRDHGLSAEASLGIAERTFRGSDGRTPGLGRERVYLGAWLRIREHLARRPQDEDVLARGQVALDAIGALRESASSARHAGGRPNAGRLARGG